MHLYSINYVRSARATTVGSDLAHAYDLNSVCLDYIRPLKFSDSATLAMPSAQINGVKIPQEYIHYVYSSVAGIDIGGQVDHGEPLIDEIRQFAQMDPGQLVDFQCIDDRGNETKGNAEVQVEGLKDVPTGLRFQLLLIPKQKTQP